MPAFRVGPAARRGRGISLREQSPMNRSSQKHLLCLALATVVAAPPAQEPSPAAGAPGAAEARALALAHELVVPIHTLPNDASGGAEYGWWAAGSAYKCSFHDGFVFYPY